MTETTKKPTTRKKTSASASGPIAIASKRKSAALGADSSFVTLVANRTAPRPPRIVGAPGANPDIAGAPAGLSGDPVRIRERRPSACRDSGFLGIEFKGRLVRADDPRGRPLRACRWRRARHELGS